MSRYIILLLILFVSHSARAGFVTNSLFGDHAVLQRGIPVPVWGTADKGEQITVEFNGQRKQAAESNGQWMVTLDAMSAGGPYSMVISGAESRIEIADMYVGEVWVCSGQSNMERQLGPRPPQPLIVNWEQERDAADYPLIREYYVPINTVDDPVEDIGSKWVVCSPETVKEFSCIGYFFARDLYKALNIPVGIIFSAVGGSPAEHWTSRPALERCAEFKTMVERYDRSLAEFPKRMAQYKREGSEGRPPVNPAEQRHVYGHYNAMISPLQPYAIKGVVWYQGENNRSHPQQYQRLLPVMIADWRTNWGQGNFPFLFVQLAPFKEIGPEIREAQLRILKTTDNTAMVVTTDCGDANDIHPPHKQPVGYRLSLAARALACGETLEYSGPVYGFTETKGGRITVYFSHAANGLVSKGGPLKGFAVAGEDGIFFPAKAEIKGNSVTVSSQSVKNPKTVRYGWENVPDVNLYNKEGLPASPFTTASLY